ncbi:MarR family winged helix-turn-helix transcriptional regulator [Deinococcus multiflagellatus]|uniref:MarR family winged helix-turn-helix transcriptional regulator n=1 Tax=Deinococcus multiflagellatus TaxID=1656887 RepID=UPI001CCEB42A|nr:MarR family transcriptional regulator [Deinococcus multiflagellatus]MBZ9714536.1 MarR family transcriptional regulator [Deinococcus multiflagellatus]
MTPPELSPPDRPPPTPEHVEAAQRLGHTMKRLHRLISSRVMRGMQDELQGHDLSFSQVTALHQLRAHAPLSVTQLSERTRLSLPAASHLVERLVKRGLAARQENPDNRREKLVDLTDAGRSVVGRMDAEFVRAYVTTFTGLNLDTITAAERHLQSLLDELEPLSPPCQEHP